MIKICTKCKAEKGVEEFNKKGLKYTSHCKKCRNAHGKVYRQNNPNKIREAQRKYNKKNPEKKNFWSKMWKKNNPEKAKIIRKNWEKKNPESVKATTRKVQAKRRAVDIKFRLDGNFSCLLRSAIKGNKAGRSWESLVGYSSGDLHNHLESLFIEGMSWKNYGKGSNKWNIGHRLPVCSFSYIDTKNSQFKACWSLNNLFPQWQIENQNKIKEDKKMSAKKTVKNELQPNQ